VTIQFTLPSFNALPGPGCGVSEVPLEDLDSLFVQWRPAGAPARTLRAFRVRGWEGAPFYVGLAAIGDTAGTVWLVTSDLSGNRDRCPAAIAVNGGTTDVPLTHRERLVRFYDLMGRRVERPTKPGIYFRRVEGERTGRVVIVR
jgi:hypothetical protein